MTMFKCSVCKEKYGAVRRSASGICLFCDQMQKFAAFAKSCGLQLFPAPDGERYLYHLDLACAGKKGEHADFVDVLWNALVRAKGGEDALFLSE